MNDTKELQVHLSLPQVSQIGVVVEDIDRAVDYYTSIFGLGPFTKYEFQPDRHWFRGEPSPLRMRMAKAMWGDLEWELLQPLQGPSLHQEFLTNQGEGLQHLGFNVRNYDEIYNRMVENGFDPVMRAESYMENYGGDLKACYFDTRRVGGVIFEVIWKSWLPECK